MTEICGSNPMGGDYALGVSDSHHIQQNSNMSNTVTTNLRL